VKNQETPEKRKKRQKAFKQKKITSLRGLKEEDFADNRERDGGA